MKRTAVLSALTGGLAGWLAPSAASASDGAQIQSHGRALPRQPECGTADPATAVAVRTGGTQEG